ncbi:MAG: DegT/DnrJ/EryC1/StrS family aminotransferase [Pirellulaceae bacterium]
MTASTCDETSLITLADYENVFRQLHANQYFTNHGPLANEFESTLEVYLQIDHVVAVGNESLALLLGLASLELQGDVVVPAWGGDLVAQIAKTLRLPVRFCEVSRATHQVSVQTLQQVVDDQVAAVCLVEMYGSRCDVDVVDWLLQQEKQVVVLALDSFACESKAAHVISHPSVVTVFGFGPRAILSTSQGGAVATTNEEIAQRCRNIRSSYGARRSIQVTATCNGRFSEFQAGVGLINYGYLQQSIDRNHAIAAVYDAAIADVPNIQRFPFAHTTVANGQCYPIIVDSDSIQKLTEVMRSFDICLPEGKPSPEHHPIAWELARRVTLLPVNNDAASGLAGRIAEQIRMVR